MGRGVRDAVGRSERNVCIGRDLSGNATRVWGRRCGGTYKVQNWGPAFEKGKECEASEMAAGSRKTRWAKQCRRTRGIGFSDLRR